MSNDTPPVLCLKARCRAHLWAAASISAKLGPIRRKQVLP